MLWWSTRVPSLFSTEVGQISHSQFHPMTALKEALEALGEMGQPQIHTDQDRSLSISEPKRA